MIGQKEPQYIELASGKIEDIILVTLNERYEVGRLLHSGNNSCVFKCTDVDKRHKNLVVKIFE